MSFPQFRKFEIQNKQKYIAGFGPERFFKVGSASESAPLICGLSTVYSRQVSNFVACHILSNKY